MRDRREPTRSNLIPFRIPTAHDAPDLPPANGGTVVAFRRKAAAPATKPNLWRIAYDLWCDEHPEAARG